MKIFVTGGSGFIGSHLIRLLGSKGHDIATTLTAGENVITGLKGVKTFGRNLKSLKDEAVKYNDVLFHLATDEDRNSPEEKAYETNLHTPLALFRRFADAGCRQFVYASSTAVYGNSPPPFVEDQTSLNPLTPCARSKAEFEQKAREFGDERHVNVIGLRFSDVYGPGEHYKRSRSSLVHQMISQCSVGESPRLFWDGCQRRDWVYIKDAVRATANAMRVEGREVINIGFGRSWSFLELLDIVNNLINHRYRCKFIPHPFVRTYQLNTECDISKADRLLKFEPVYDLRSGVEDYIREWS